MSDSIKNNSSAIAEQEFSQLMADCGLEAGNKSVAVAVSGGADSMALSMLVARWGKAVYLSFDHKLRPESAAEIAKVNKWLTKLGLKHVVLNWHGEKPTSNIQQAAREARYLAMEKWCQEQGVEHLLIAHHEEDQAETFLMRLARGSGVDGLSAMSFTSEPLFLDAGPQYVRPLLAQPKQRLVKTLEQMGQGWIDDPSNENMLFTRVQARKMLADEPLEGLNSQRMAKTAKRMKRVRRVLDRLTSELIDSALNIENLVQNAGFCQLNVKKLNAADEEIALRALSKILTHFGGGTYPPRLLPVERLFAEITREGFSGATLAGCHISAGKNYEILIGREENAVSDEILLTPGKPIHWDNRYIVHVEQNLPPFLVKKLDLKQWREIVEKNDHVAEIKMPKEFLPSIPAFYMDENSKKPKIVAVPALDYWLDGHIGISAEFKPKQGLKPKLS